MQKLRKIRKQDDRRSGRDGNRVPEKSKRIQKEQMHIKHSRGRNFVLFVCWHLVLFGSRCAGRVASAKVRHKTAAK